MIKFQRARIVSANSARFWLLLVSCICARAHTQTEISYLALICPILLSLLLFVVAACHSVLVFYAHLINTFDIVLDAVANQEFVYSNVRYIRFIPAKLNFDWIVSHAFNWKPINLLNTGSRSNRNCCSIKVQLRLQAHNFVFIQKREQRWEKKEYFKHFCTINSTRIDSFVCV